MSIIQCVCTNEVYKNHVLDLRNFFVRWVQTAIFSKRSNKSHMLFALSTGFAKKSNSFLVSRVETAINVARSMRLLQRIRQKRCSPLWKRSVRKGFLRQNRYELQFCEIISITTTICQHYQQLLMKFHIKLRFHMSKITANVNGSMHSHKRILQKTFFFFLNLALLNGFLDLRLWRTTTFKIHFIETYDLTTLPNIFRNFFLRNCFFKSGKHNVARSMRLLQRMLQTNWRWWKCVVRVSFYK